MKSTYMEKKSLGIRGRLILGFSAIILFFVILVVTSIMLITESKSTAENIIEKDLPTYDSLIDLTSTIYNAKSELRELAINYSDDGWKNFEGSVLALEKTNQIADFQIKAINNNSFTNSWQQAKILIDQLIQDYKSLLNASGGKNNNSLFLTVNNKVSDASNKTLDILMGPMGTDRIRNGGIVSAQYDVLEKNSISMINNMNTILLTEYVVSILGVILSALVIVFTSRSIIRHINIFRAHSNRIASGDLRQTLTIYGSDELAELGVDLNSMTDSLASVTKQISVASHNIASTMEEVKQAVDVQSSGASEQASSINEITASLEEIEKSSAQTMEKAKALGDVAERTRDKGQEGLESVEMSIQGMKSIRDKVQTIAQTILDLSNQTQQIGEITAVVNSLAQQSKMLALNASIEAAKAGEAGKGFAVVAAEVKNLAEQSEQSTAQVQKILENIKKATEKAVMVTEEGTKGVDHGTTLVEQTGVIVRGLSDVIHEATLASQQIEAAVKQESVGIEQITAGMNEINQVTSSFVASSKQTLDAITQLENISKQLKDQVDVYKV